MATPINFSASQLINFSTSELQILACSSASAAGAFVTNQNWALDLMIYNGGSVAAYVVVDGAASPTAKNNAGGASGTATTYVAPGAYVVIQKGSCQYFAGITDSGTTTLYLHAGRGA